MLNFKNLSYRPHESKEEVVWDFHLIDDIEFIYSVDEDCYLLVYFKNSTFQRLDLNPDKNQWDVDGIIVEGHVGTWYVIDYVVYDEDIYYLLEHEEFGDEAACLIVDNNTNIIAEDVYDDWLEALEDALIIPQF